MKSTGAIRYADTFGRVALPKKLRIKLKIKEQDPLEIYVENGRVVLKKYKPACVFCNSMHKLTTFRGYSICRECREKINAVQNKSG
ncbi:AbrB/MazE/SpoVT family DNA-binding domain-containing protein [Caproiciproducens sp. CPB-2]|uniref:AbrB/MazE/SpoVT family DNA-binding domain-containing protein n=1 Tax=unclassified Caproiciproducens TaxID=2643836 RepID=UPI0023DCC3C2|nr:AbrB/MazE/SpoVT family DNA-binding domain-containing protein [Caproiciproducens sp. CPB-2]MDF1493957.1 AbrB/MazE/SpoVT family DNA-binding domain-containing protein [Caproiciproducens sp. CPB-2]